MTAPPEPGDWDFFDDDDWGEDDDHAQRELESLLAECGWFDEDEPWCQLAGTEHCDFACPLRWQRRQAGAGWRAKQRRRHGRGVGPDPRRFGFRAPWLIRRRCRLRRERREHKETSMLDLNLTTTPPRPRIVCLCGSTRFYDAFQQANYLETMAGRIVLTVGFYPHSQEQAHGEAVGCTPSQKRMLDALHLQKVALADEVLVLNVGGYVGESTSREIAEAERLGKLIRWLEPPAAPALPSWGVVDAQAAP